MAVWCGVQRIEGAGFEVRGPHYHLIGLSCDTYDGGPVQLPDYSITFL